jgi:hypothetical protein
VLHIHACKREERGEFQKGVGLVFLILVVAFVGTIVLGFSAIKQAPSSLYSFTDSSGSVQFVDSLDKVPAEHRAAAASRPDVAPINKAKFKSLVSSMISGQRKGDTARDAQ